METNNLVQGFSTFEGSSSALPPYERHTLVADVKHELKRIDHCLQKYLAKMSDESAFLSRTLEHLDDIHSALTRLSSRLRRSSNERDVRLAHLQLAQVLDLDYKLSSDASPTTESECSFDFSPVTPLPPFSFPSVSLEETMPPLEFHLRKSGIPGTLPQIELIGPKSHRVYSLAALTDWSKRIGERMFSTSRIGALRSVRLFRERAHLVYHEYIILSFECDEENSSWLRVERRAGGTKMTSAIMHPDSFLGSGPLIESVVFANTLADLVEDSDDETACLHIRNSTEDSSLRAVSSIILQQLEGAEISPQFHKLSENCRWFARRNILNIAEHLKSSEVDHIVYWRNSPSSYNKLAKRLQRNPFGGRQLERSLVAAQILINSGWGLYREGKLQEALLKSTDAFLSIPSVSSMTERQHLYSSSRHLHGLILLGRGDVHGALKSFRLAYENARLIQSTNRYLSLDALDSIATTLIRKNHLNEAFDLRYFVIRELQQGYSPTSLPPTHERAARSLFAKVLHHHAEDLAFICESESQRLKVYEHEIAILESLHLDEPDSYNFRLAVAKMEYAAALNDVGRSHEAINVSHEAVLLMKAVFGTNPSHFRRFLATALYNHARYASCLGQWEESCLVGSECAVQYRLLYLENDGMYRGDYVDALINYGYDSRGAGHSEEAIGSLRLALQIVQGLDVDFHSDTIVALLQDITELQSSSRSLPVSMLPY